VSEAPPSVYILHGEDELAIQQFVSGLVARMGDSSIAEVNISRLDGRVDSLLELKSAVTTMPFLTRRRLVIFVHPLTRIPGQQAQMEFTKFLEGIQPSTGLVLVEDHLLTEERDKKRNKLHWLEKWATRAGSKVYLRAFPLPKRYQMAERIREIAGKEKIKITPQASELLAALVGENPLLAERELNKLAAFVNYERSTEVDDVNQLTPDYWSGDIFEMVDAIGLKDHKKAIDMLCRQLADKDGMMIFGMIVRQFRLLLLVAECVQNGMPLDKMAQSIKIPLFVVEKLVNQSRKFSLHALENIYHRLAEYDEEMKTGILEPDVYLEVLVAEFTH
jgi:DNA polymerase-3 subunit delta